MSVIPAITAVRLTGARNRTDLPLLVLGPAVATSALTLWADAAAHLSDVFDVLAWDLPGQGHNRSVPDEQYSTAELATGVVRVVDDVLAERGELGRPFFYAGGSVGGAVGRELMLHTPGRVDSAVLFGASAGSGEFDVPVLVVAAAADEVTPPDRARLMREHFLGEVFVDVDDRSGALDSRSRALARLTAMLVSGPKDDLADEHRRALADGLTTDEIDELRLLVEDLP